MSTRLSHRAMYEKFISCPVTKALEDEVLTHLRHVEREGTTTEIVDFPELFIHRTKRTYRDENAKKARGLIARLTADDSQEWLNLLFDAVDDYLTFEKAQDDRKPPLLSAASG